MTGTLCAARLPVNDLISIAARVSSEAADVGGVEWGGAEVGRETKTKVGGGGGQWSGRVVIRSRVCSNLRPLIGMVDRDAVVPLAKCFSTALIFHVALYRRAAPPPSPARAPISRAPASLSSDPSGTRRISLAAKLFFVRLSQR